MKIKLFIQVVIVLCLGLGLSSYGNDVLCAALRTSQAYEKGDITDERLQELYSLWKDGLNERFRTSYDTEDPISTYEDFKIIFGLGKKHIQFLCPMDNEVNCNAQLQEKSKSIGKEVKVFRRNFNADDNLVEVVLEETEDLFGSLRTFWNNLCDDDLENAISKITLEFQETIKMKYVSNSNKGDL